MYGIYSLTLNLILTGSVQFYKQMTIYHVIIGQKAHVKMEKIIIRFFITFLETVFL